MFSEEQKKAINTDGNVLLTACPGSGKTRVLTNRIIREVLKNKDSNKLTLGITFTNVAAEEIEHRILNSIDVSNKYWIGTIHSFCNEWIIKPYMCYHEKLKNGYMISDEYQSNKILSEVKSKNKISSFELINTKRDLDGSFLETDTKKLNVLKEYYDILTTKNLVDYDTLLFYAYELMNSNSFISLNLSNIFSLICLDEFQDTSNLQYNILAKIINQSIQKTNIFVVGDRDQAIYHSLGGVAKSDDEIKSLYNGNFTCLSLSGNFRSHQNIIDFYKNFQIESINIVGLNQLIQSENASITYNNQDTHKENIHELIAKYIQSSLDIGYFQDDICIIAPSWYDLLYIEKELKNIMTNINFYSVNSTSILRKNGDFIIWYKIAKLNLMPRTSNYFLYRLKIAKEIISELEVFLDSSINTYKPKDILKILNSIQPNLDDAVEYLEELFSKFLEKLNIEIELFSKLLQNHNSFLEKLEAYKNENIEKGNSDISINSIKKSFHNFEGVKISTIHGVKGEEYKTVICFGLLHGKLPHWGDIINKNINYTNRVAKRLLYVVGSRAKNRLHLISESGHFMKGEKPYESAHILIKCNYKYDNILQI